MDYTTALDASSVATMSTPVLVGSLFGMILTIVINWKIFSKAGEAGWKCLIPIYNTYILFKIVTGNGLKMFFLIIPLFNAIYSIVFCFKMARAYGKSTGFGFLLLFFAPIALLIMAFSGSVKYVGPDVPRTQVQQ